MWTLVTIFFFALEANAEGWDDFTNNLATDLAPLIALFGEQATKQFLSESTSLLDNIIFAVAPLGILTAVVSVIRVLGSASLRAFVGRAQEGRGLAEAELCSSTSHDVCELWNNGGIARVFGRPQILEFIFDEEEIKNGKNQNVQNQHRKTQETEQCQGINRVFYEVFASSKVVSRPTAGIYKPQEYVKSLPQEVAESVLPPQATHPKKSDDREDLRTEFAPNPNLSLNVGIQKPGRVTLYGAAIFGCFLQASVLGYGTWAVYVKDLRKEGRSPTRPYFWLTVTGTLLLFTGMSLCAWLIEKSTQERIFKLRKHVFWLQPGNQRVGDQNFEAFAYSTKLEEYTTSWKEEVGRRAEWRRKLYVWEAISTSMIGFVLQFTGLRGLHASVAMYQLAVTLIMAFIRSLLRSQRLKESENLLQARDFQDQIEGHELDWQTLRIESTIAKAATTSLSKSTDANVDYDTPSDNGLCWSIIEKSVHLEEAKIEGLKAELVDQLKKEFKAKLAVNTDGSAAGTSSFRDSEDSSGDQDEWDGKCTNALIRWIARVEGNNQAIVSQSQSPHVAKKLLCYRSRLSYLTNDDAPTTAQRWGLPVRDQALKLQAAIQSVADYVFSDTCQAEISTEWGTTAAFCWALNCVTLRRSATTPLPVHLMVHRVRGQWRIDICQLEAALGLWTWSIKMEVEKGKKERRRKGQEVESDDKKSTKATKRNGGGKTGELAEIEEKVEHRQILTDGNTNNHEENDKDRILSRKIFTVIPSGDLEEEERAKRQLNTWVLRERRQPVYDRLNIQAPRESGSVKQGRKTFPSLSLPMTKKLLFSSHSGHHRDQERQDIGLLSVQTENPVLVMATQDIFTSFIDALASITSELKGTNIVQSLRSDTTVTEEVVATSKARPFLGLAHNHTEHLTNLFIQAGLGSRDEALLSVVPPFHSRSLLPSLMRDYELLKSQVRKLSKDGRWRQAENLLIAVRDEVENDSRYGDSVRLSEDLFGEFGKLYKKAMSSADQPYRIFGYFGIHGMWIKSPDVTNRIKEIRQNYSWVAQEMAKLHKDMLPAELESRFKSSGPHFDVGMTLEDVTKFDSAYPFGLLVAFQFKEQISKANQSAQAQLLIWAAQKGCKELVEDLLDMGLGVDGQDYLKRTPLSYACEEGSYEVVEMLFKAGAVMTVDSCGRMPLSHAAQSGHEAVVKLLLGMSKVDIDLADAAKRTPLSYAAGGKRYAAPGARDAAPEAREAVLKLLLDTGKVNVDLKDKWEETPLSYAARKGYEKVVKLLLDTGNVDVNSKNDDGCPPLFYAAGKGHEAVVKLLLDTGKANVDLKNKWESTPLSYAAGSGQEKVVKLLLDTGNVDVNSRNRHKYTPLLCAARGGDEGVVKLLLDTGNVDVDSRDENRRTPLSYAAEKGHEEAVKLLLDTGNVDVDSRDENKRTPLSYAAEKGHEEAVKLLLDTGNIDVDSRDKDRCTPLSYAAEKGHEAVVRLLLDTGNVDINSRDKDRCTPLSHAARNEREEIVKLLLDTGNVDINSRDKDRCTPLSYAARRGYEEVVRLLLDTGNVDVDSEDKGGCTPLSYAAGKGHEAVVKLLLDTGNVDVDSKDKGGCTPLSYAAYKGHEAVLKLLLDTGKVNVDLKDKMGRTPLSYAAERGDKAVIKPLLDTNKADINSRDREKKTPLSWAQAKGHMEVVELLQSYAAPVSQGNTGKQTGSITEEMADKTADGEQTGVIHRIFGFLKT